MPKIFLHKYKALSGYEVYKEIENIMKVQCPLSPYQKEYLQRELGDSGMNGNLDMPFQAYRWEKYRKDGKNGCWRVTAPLFLLCELILLPVVCIRWVLTGIWNLPKEWKITQWMIKWEQNIFE